MGRAQPAPQFTAREARARRRPLAPSATQFIRGLLPVPAAADTGAACARWLGSCPWRTGAPLGSRRGGRAWQGGREPCKGLQRGPVARGFLCSGEARGQRGAQHMAILSEQDGAAI